MKYSNFMVFLDRTNKPSKSPNYMKEMSVEQALKKYKALIIREKKAREEKKTVRDFLISAGADLDGSKWRAERNKKMFHLFQSGSTNNEIAQLFGLTASCVGQYRRRFERQQTI